MAIYKVTSIEIVASYDNIDPAFAMRPTPQFISQLLYSHLSDAESIDFPQAFDQVVGTTYEDPNPKIALASANQALAAKLGDVIGDSISFDMTPYYRPVSPKRHENIVYLYRDSGSGLAPWPFSFDYNGHTYTGYVCAAIVCEEQAEAGVFEPSSSKKSETQTVGARF